jgi:hypothetical protein
VAGGGCRLEAPGRRTDRLGDRLCARLADDLPSRAQLSHTGDGFVALGATLLPHDRAEAAHGCGFVAVFVAALALRDAERRHAFHMRTHGDAGDEGLDRRRG